jgi:hypothetical protein
MEGRDQGTWSSLVSLAEYLNGLRPKEIPNSTDSLT